MCNTAVTPLNTAITFNLLKLLLMRNLGGFFLPALRGILVSEVYTKTPLTFEQQLQQLKERGLIIDDDDLALFHLKTISYYRLSAYWHPFRKTEQDDVLSDDFEEGTQFTEVIRLYEFDRRLRLLVMDAIERIEVYARTLFAYHIGHRYGAFGHTRAANFHHNFYHAPWLEKLEEDADRSIDVFISHYKNKYAGFPTLPIWMVTEVMSLGSLSKGYRGLKNDDKKIISDEFALHHRCLADWFHTLTYIRNICSHHGRLWNRELAIRPGMMRARAWNPPVSPRNDRVFYILLIIRYLLRKAHSSDKWKEQCDNLLKPLAEDRKWRAAMGIPEDWIDHPVWQ